jgi:hypothetical protein
MSPAALGQLVKLLKAARRPHEENQADDHWPGND